MKLDELIENKRSVLYESINANGIVDKKTMRISHQLDKLIVKSTRRTLA